MHFILTVDKDDELGILSSGWMKCIFYLNVTCSLMGFKSCIYNVCMCCCFLKIKYSCMNKITRLRIIIRYCRKIRCVGWFKILFINMCWVDWEQWGINGLCLQLLPTGLILKELKKHYYLLYIINIFDDIEFRLFEFES